MDLTSDIFTTILSPLAAFAPPPPSSSPSPPPPSSAAPLLLQVQGLQDQAQGQDESPTKELEWRVSPLNPATRIDSLAPLPAPTTFRLDSDGGSLSVLLLLLRRRAFAVPAFARGRPPLRVDTYLPPLERWPKRLRDALLLLRPGGGDGHGHNGAAAVGGWLVRALERWVTTEEGGGGVEAVEDAWWRLPYGSAIELEFGEEEEGEGDEEVRVHLVPDYEVEQGMLAVEQLRGMWAGELASLAPTVVGPRGDDSGLAGEGNLQQQHGMRLFSSSSSLGGVPVVDWEELRFRRQVHETVALVEVRGGGGQASRECAFKSLLRQQRDMYHELKMLLVLGRHPNLIPPPVGVVVKKARFGNRRGVCGFLLEWFPLGSLRERLLRDDYGRTTAMRQRFRWARQIVEVLIHVNGHPAGFYPDLKPDNIMLRENKDTGLLDAVLIDLEQRGGWFAWSPPEVAYVEYLEILAESAWLPDALREEITAQLREYYGDPGWEPDADSERRYHNAEGGFSRPWLALLRARRDGGDRSDLLERAQVFMLGKLLWCIFEGQPFVRCGIDHEMLQDPEPDYEAERTGKARAFPEFKETPVELRRLIRACTAGAPEWEVGGGCRRVLALRGGKLWPVAAGVDAGCITADVTLATARSFWRHEVEEARKYMAQLLLASQPRGFEAQTNSTPAPVLGLLGQVRMRPTLVEILQELARIERRVVSN